MEMIKSFIIVLGLICLGVFVVIGIGWLWKIGFNYLIDYFGVNIKHIGIWEALVIIFLIGWKNLLSFNKD